MNNLELCIFNFDVITDENGEVIDIKNKVEVNSVFQGEVKKNKEEFIKLSKKVFEFFEKIIRDSDEE
ncbi:MAG: hypothetical protein IAC55_03375 [Tyzzerella sp.]|uniref:Uncharacterized protein n=1 Tax=Candidatus Fimicola merdigallinarum TaxID=2840819 RepID=A0A9D9H3W8_9FIRM|nr:hypothetical protein [Candidatus Fimicola merdigallinarum]